MAILLDNYTVAERGRVELNVQLSFEVNVTAQEAQEQVRRWVQEEISLLLTAQMPLLVVGQRPFWQTPVMIRLPRQGEFEITAVAVDVVTGEMIDPVNSKASILQQLETKIKPRLLGDKFSTQPVSPEYIRDLHPKPQFTF